MVMKKYNKTKQTNFTKKVSAIAKKAVYKVAETKSPIQIRTSDLFNDLVYAQNVTFAIGQGNTSFAIEGKKFHIKNITVKGRIYSYNTATPTNSNLHFRFLLIRTKKALTNTFGAIAADDVFRGTTNEVATVGHVDLHKVDLIKDYSTKVLPTPIGSTGTSNSFSMNIPINKTVTVDTENGGYLKDSNYYIITTCYKADNPAANVGALRMQWATNYKDI